MHGFWSTKDIQTFSQTTCSVVLAQAYPNNLPIYKYASIGCDGRISYTHLQISECSSRTSLSPTIIGGRVRKREKEKGGKGRRERKRGKGRKETNSMYCEEVVEPPRAGLESSIYIDGFGFVELL